MWTREEGCTTSTRHLPSRQQAMWASHQPELCAGLTRALDKFVAKQLCATALPDSRCLTKWAAAVPPWPSNTWQHNPPLESRIGFQLIHIHCVAAADAMVGRNNERRAGADGTAVCAEARTP